MQDHWRQVKIEVHKIAEQNELVNASSNTYMSKDTLYTGDRDYLIARQWKTLGQWHAYDDLTE